MQYRDQGDKIQVLAYRSYNREKRRANVKMLGSFDRYNFKMTDDLLDNMTEDEKKEFTVKLDEMKQSSESRLRLYSFNSTVDSIIKSYDGMINHGLTFDVSKVTAEQAAAIYHVINALTKALEKHGHAAPKRAYKTKSKNSKDPSCYDDLISDPLN